MNNLSSFSLAFVIAAAAFPALAQDRAASAPSAARAASMALATYHVQEVARAREIAGQHQKMANLYRADSVGARGGSGLYAHCNNVVSSYQGIASEYDSMAVVHRQLADQAKP